MDTNAPLQKAQIEDSLRELDDLARAEYDESLETLLLRRDPLSISRVQRLVGVALKRKFAKTKPPVAHSETRALRSWPWPDLTDDMKPVEPNASRELALLEQLRLPGPWNIRTAYRGTAEDLESVSWTRFKEDVEHERGLFKIIALYAADKFNKREARSFQAYLEAKESRRFEAGLDLANLLFDAAVMGPLAAVLGVPTVAVGIALVGVQFGYRKLTDPAEAEIGDSSS